jgi:N-methylhydantoinase A
MPAGGLSVGIDIGGTFTDLVAFNPDTNQFTVAKARTTPRELTGGVLGALRKSGVKLAAAEALVHGTTLVVNAALERRGARTALVTTRGFRDVLEIGRGNRTGHQDLFSGKPAPLVPRSLRFEVRERIAADGSVSAPISMEDLDAVIEAAEKHALEAIAICFLHAYANPEHEEKARNYLQSVLPDVYICASSDTARVWREFERSSTTALNAFVGPQVGKYVSQLEEAAAQAGFKGRLHVMQSSGGVMTAAQARRYAVGTVESGPAAGMIAAAQVGGLISAKLVLGFDMGGTTAKAALVESGLPRITDTLHIDGGVPVQIPSIDINEIAVGGGSIAWIDEVGALKVGPRSAGSEPGPVCFGAGGTEPTVTDANVVLGRINPARYLGGEMKLDVEAARRAIAEKIAAPLGIGEEEAAAGIIAVADSHMALALRRVATANGADPRQTSLVAFGGGGPLHGAAVAREIGMPRVIVPPHPACFSALGMLLADVRRDCARTFVRPFPAEGYEELNDVLEALRRDGIRDLQAAGIPGRNAQCAAYLELRYAGQQWPLTVPVGAAFYVSAEDAKEIRSAFDALYEARFGHAFPDTPTEIVSVRIVATGTQRKPKFATLRGRDPGATPKAQTRRVHFDGAGTIDCPVYRREELLWRDKVAGPALIEETYTTLLVGPGDEAGVDEQGFVFMKVKEAAHAQ